MRWNSRNTFLFGLASFAAVYLGMMAFDTPLRASGFYIANQSAASVAVANAGASALAEDAATVVYNPAGLIYLDRPEVLLSSGLNFVSTSFQRGSAKDFAGFSVMGSSDTNDTPFVIPAFFASYPIDDRFGLGFGVFVPFGQSTKYADGWIGRYQVQQVALKTVDIRPAIAYRVDSNLSVGAGLDVVYSHFQRSSAIDFGALLGMPGMTDGRLVASAQDWSVGYDVGAIFEPSKNFRIGVNYRSKVENALSGSAMFSVPAAATPLTAGGAFGNTNVTSDLPFPASVSTDVSYPISDSFMALIGLRWTQWSTLRNFTATFGNPTPGLSQNLNWHDTWGGSVGGIYRLNTSTDLRAGFAFDQTPMADQSRIAEVPQGDGIGLAVGTTTQINEHILLAFSYEYSHFTKAPLNYATVSGGALAGTDKADAHTFAVQSEWKF